MSNNVKDQIIHLHKMMKEETLSCGVKESKYDSLILDLIEAEDQELEEMNEWLERVYKNQFKDLMSVINLLPKEIWDRYEHYGLTGLREQGLLKIARKDLRKAWDNPYRTAKQLKRKKSKKKITKHDNMEQNKE